MARRSAKTPKTPAAKAAPAGVGVCHCGCKGALKNKRTRFLQGHDSKLKSIMLKVRAGDLPRSAIPAIAIPLLRSVGVAGMRLKK
jgi:hypothetical protein